MDKKPVLWIIIPCYNEQEVLPLTAPMFLEKLLSLEQSGRVSQESRILFVDDGSKDRTWEIISELAERDPRVLGISQSRNRGHQNALVAGMMEAKDRCDITITIDCDGQDDLNAMDDMVDRYLDGCEIVYGVRSERESDTWFKRSTAQGFYRLLGFFGAEVVYNHADYRLVSSRVLKEFADFREVNLYLRGMFPLVGFKSTSVYYKRRGRLAGDSHYSLADMITLAFDGITRGTVPGWASMTCIICFLGGIQLLSLGVIGEYVGKTYMETKQRPRYIISERTWEKTQERRAGSDKESQSCDEIRSMNNNKGET